MPKREPTDEAKLYAAAMEQNDNDAPSACHWVLYTYRNKPWRSDERDLIYSVVRMLVERMDGPTYRRWSDWCALPTTDRPEKP